MFDESRELLDVLNNGEAARAVWIRSAIDRYEDGLVRYAHRLTRDAERARDIVQDTFLKLCQQDPQELDGRLRQWLYTVCRNRSLDTYRKEKRMTLAAQDTVVDSVVRSPAPEALAEHQETVSQLLRSLDELPDIEQEVLRLRFQQGLCYREIAEITGMSTSNVGFRIHQGLQALRAKMVGLNR